jgi:hypothetical protein
LSEDTGITHCRDVLLSSRGDLLVPGGDGVEVILRDGRKMRTRTPDLSPLLFTPQGVVAEIQIGRRRSLGYLPLDARGSLGRARILVPEIGWRSVRSVAMDGQSVAWVEIDDRGQTAGLYWTDASTRKVVRLLPEARVSPAATIDVFLDRWLLVHDDRLVRLVHLDSGQSLELAVPGPVVYASPDGILYHLGDRHGRFWDPVTDQRADLRLPDEGYRMTVAWGSFGARASAHLLLASVDALEQAQAALLHFRPGAPGGPAPAAGTPANPPALARLTGLYQEDRNRTELSTTWQVMGELHWPYPAGAVPALERILCDYREANTRRMAAAHLGRSSQPKARAVLLSALQHCLKPNEDFYVRDGVLQALSQTAGKADVPHILAQVRDQRLSEDAMQAFAVLGGPAAAARLDDEIRSGDRAQSPANPSNEVRAGHRAIAQIRSRPAFEQILARLRTRPLAAVVSGACRGACWQEP